MTTVSYAQNYEDVMLLRALGGVARGFYIDVGAQHPVKDSVTRAFYERGWHGINIEPVTQWYDQLVVDRPHDVNLQLAVSDAPGHLHLFEVEGSGLSTTDAEFAERHRQAGFDIRELDVECVTLDQICSAHVVGEIHFLKVDCEGAEAAALRGISLQRIRPWIILIEATEPNSQKPAYAEWEPLLTGQDYRFVYEDGLNRFYVAQEHSELTECFKYPPNVFDRFVRASESGVRGRLAAVEAELSALNNVERMTRAELEREFLRSENERREAELVLQRAGNARREAELVLQQGEIERREHALTELKSALASHIESIEILRSHTMQMSGEVGRLHHEVVLRDRNVAELTELLRIMRRSKSWRLTVPLRVCSRRVRSLVRFAKRLTYRVLRQPARFSRPLLRYIAKWHWVRSLASSMFRYDSKPAIYTRIFIFGLESQDGRTKGSDAPLTRSARVAMRTIEMAGRDADKPSRAPSATDGE